MFKNCFLLVFLDLTSFNTIKTKSMNSIFFECKLLSSLNLSNFNTSQVKDMNSMFYSCSSLILLELSNFDTSQVTDMNFMFADCSKLSSLNISSFNTSQVTTMENMFDFCSALTSLDLSNFNTSTVTNMDSMFVNCKSFISLNLSNFDTSQVITMSNMFYDCLSLISLNLSNCITSKVTDMDNMFHGCSHLTSLDLSNFNTLHLLNVGNFFNNCINLEYINLKNFNSKNMEDFQNMFSNVPDNVVICINKTITHSEILSQIENRKCYVIDCTDDWKSKQKKIINNSNQCIESCNNSSQFKYEYNGKCYDNCSNGFFCDEKSKINKCKCELEECLICPNVALNKKLCTKCNINYYPKENDPFNFGDYINCYKEPEGYYFYNNLYKKCYYTCKTCNISGNDTFHNCIECNFNYSFEIKTKNYITLKKFGLIAPCQTKTFMVIVIKNGTIIILMMKLSHIKKYDILK